jgi:putative ABC transport system permease protein
MSVSDWTIIKRSLLSRKLSTILTVLLVALACAMLITLLSLRKSAGESVRRGIGNVQLLVSADVSPLSSVLNALFYVNLPARAFRITEAEQIAQDPRAAWAIPILHGDNYRGFKTFGTTRQFFDRVEPVRGTKWALTEGTFFNGTFEVVLGAETARLTQLRVGDSITVTHGARPDPSQEHRDWPLKVAGILEPTGTAHDRAVFWPLEASWVIHAADWRKADGDSERPTPENLRASEKLVTGILIRARSRDDSDAPPSLNELGAVLRQRPGLLVASPDIEVRKLLELVGGIERVLLAMAVLVLVGGALTILLVMQQALELRRRQVAVIRVLGASQSRVFGLLLTESAVIGVLGAIVGCGLAILGLRLASSGLAMNVGLYIDAPIDQRATVIVAAGTVVLCSLAGLVPAVMAYRTAVLEHLRPLG